MTLMTSSLVFKECFFPSIPQKDALNFLVPFLNSPSIDQYSSGIKALISFSRSTISFKAID